MPPRKKKIRCQADEDLRRRLSMFTACQASETCKCKGFRPQNARSEIEEETELFAADAELVAKSSNEDKCRSCEHSIIEHSNCLSLKRTDNIMLESIAQILRDVVPLTKMWSIEQVPEKKEACWDAFGFMVRSLTRFTLPVEGPWAPLPYEKLSAKYLLGKYLAHLIGTFLFAEHKTFAEKLLSEFNLWDIPSPADYETTVTGANLAEYKVVYIQWLYNIILPKSFESMIVREPVEIFGSRCLLFFLRFIMAKRVKVNEQQNVEELNYDDFLNVVSEFCVEVLAHPDTPEADLPDCVYQLKYAKVPNSQTIEASRVRKRNINPPVPEYCPIPSNTMLKCIVKMAKDEQEAKETEAKDKNYDKMTLDVIRSADVRSQIESKILEFKIIRHKLNAAPVPDEISWLSQLVQVFHILLPEMNLEYITSFVFDEDHTNIAVIKNGRVMGGVCYRSFPHNRYIEIAFFTFIQDDQVKGYGTHLMNYLKDVQVKRNCLILLTYADQDAVDFFRKQGFTEDLDIERSAHENFIKEYNGAYLMACHINPNIKYSNFDVYMKSMRDFHMAFSEISNPSDKALKRYVPPKEVKNPGEKMETVLDILKKSKDAWPFLKPVDSKERRYYSTIKFPMDLGTMDERLGTEDRPYYVDEHLFIADLNRMFANCFIFNHPETAIYRHGLNLHKLAFQLCSENFPNALLLETMRDIPAKPR